MSQTIKKELAQVIPTMRRWLRPLMLLALPLALAGCGVNTIPTKDEQVKAAWAQVQNEYQRRSDLIPNLVATVQGYAKQDKRAPRPPRSRSTPRP